MRKKGNMVKKQENGKTVHEDNVMHNPPHTHKEQIITYTKRKRNVDHQPKSIVRVPPTAFAERHGFHTQPTN
jgi:hypothetical protein